MTNLAGIGKKIEEEAMNAGGSESGVDEAMRAIKIA